LIKDKEVDLAAAVEADSKQASLCGPHSLHKRRFREWDKLNVQLRTSADSLALMINSTLKELSR
jgi:hypothetical protein